MRATILAFCATILLSSGKPIVPAQKHAATVHLDTAVWLDSSRGRSIPVAMWSKAGARTADQRPVLISHGYNENLPGTYLHYSYLCEFLADRGYFVVSIQHEAPGDEPLAMSGDLAVSRRPNWERGARNIGFVLRELERAHPELNFPHLTLLGHSNGGDMSVLYALQHPDLVENLITLDNRRMPLPRARRPRVLSLRSTDAPADEGVLPSREEQAAHGIRVVPLHDVKHNEMSDRANAAQRAEITRLVLEFLNAP